MLPLMQYRALHTHICHVAATRTRGPIETSPPQRSAVVGMPVAAGRGPLALPLQHPLIREAHYRGLAARSLHDAAHSAGVRAMISRRGWPPLSARLAYLKTTFQTDLHSLITAHYRTGVRPRQ
jgi:hypothetical protein